MQKYLNASSSTYVDEVKLKRKQVVKMEQINSIEQVASVEAFKEFKVEEEQTVEKLLEDMKLKGLALAVLVDGVKVSMDDVIKEGQSVVILPIIAGG